ncbi:MAG: glycosyltransferase family A protein [Alphaproteobacteria bacterium]
MTWSSITPDLGRLSVVVPCFNHGEYLAECLDAILDQSVVPDEIFVLDDASTDSSYAVADEYRQRHSCIRLERNATNLGAVGNINRGLERATGQWVLFAAADDWLLPEMLATAARVLAGHPGAGLWSALSLIARHGRLTILPTTRPLRRSGYLSPGRARRKMIWCDSWFMGNTCILNREKALAFGGLRPELHSFSDNFLYRQLSAKYGACFTPKPLAVWRLTSGYAARTHANPDMMHGIRSAAARIMQEEYGDLFSAAYVARFERRHRYQAATGIDFSRPDAADRLADVLIAPSDADRRMLRWLVRRGRRSALAFLFWKLRLPDGWEVLSRHLYWRTRIKREGGGS